MSRLHIYNTEHKTLGETTRRGGSTTNWKTLGLQCNVSTFGHSITDRQAIIRDVTVLLISQRRSEKKRERWRRTKWQKLWKCRVLKRTWRSIFCLINATDCTFCQVFFFCLFKKKKNLNKYTADLQLRYYCIVRFWHRYIPNHQGIMFLQKMIRKEKKKHLNGG